MADSGDLCKRNYESVLQDIDGQVAQILSESEMNPKGSIVESLVFEIDPDEILEARETLFKYAQGRYDEQLDMVGIQEPASLCMEVRKGDKAPVANAKDVCDLFMYSAGLISHFPREILSSSSRFVEITSSKLGSNSAKNECYPAPSPTDPAIILQINK